MNIYEAQIELDIRHRIEELSKDLHSAEKCRVDLSQPAKTWGGSFTCFSESIRFFDVQEYIDTLKEKYHIT